MPRNRKCFIHGTVIEICFTAEEGLPLPANPLIKLILLSIFARAQTYYPVTICHFVVMPNHMHLLVVVNDPAQIPRFVEYIKRESSHAINRLLGRERRTVWMNGYDSPIILDAEKAVSRIVYIYANPARANLVSTIDDYPHLNSWRACIDGSAEWEAARIPRNAIPQLPSGAPGLKKISAICRELTENSHENFSLIIEPDAWMLCFRETKESDPTEINARIGKMLEDEELRCKNARTHFVIGAHALTLQSVHAQHTPPRLGRRMICFSSHRGLRGHFVRWFRELCSQASTANVIASAAAWLTLIPPGLFLPGGSMSGNLNPLFVPTINNVAFSA